jgi:hypothetical protein
MKLLKIEVTDEIQIGGQPGDFGPRKTTQVAYLHGMSAYPDKWTMRYPHTDRPIPPGMYLLGAGSFRIGKYGPEVNAPDLISLEDAAAELAAAIGSKPAARATA